MIDCPIEANVRDIRSYSLYPEEGEIDAAVRVAAAGEQEITIDDLISAVERLKSARVNTGLYRPLTGEEAKEARDQIRDALNRPNP
jgi:hypothetical protein